jgi:hypothetical protein
MPPKKNPSAVVVSAKEPMSLRPKDPPPTHPPKKKRRTSAEVAAEKAAKELAKKQKADMVTAKVLAASRKENMMATEDSVADAHANHPPVNSRTKVRRLTLVVTKPVAAMSQEGG